ncbi:MAG: leucyl aminopeptidase [Planctomycetota bacterium]
MKVEASSATLGRVRDACVVLVATEGEGLATRVGSIGAGLKASVARLVERGGFSGKAGEVRLVPAGARDHVDVLVLAGVGAGKSVTAASLGDVVADALKTARGAGAPSATVSLPAGRMGQLGAREQARVVAEAAWLGLYRFEAYKEKPSEQVLDRVTVLAPRGGATAVAKGVEVGSINGEATAFARDLGNHPGNVATPTWLAERARELAAAEPTLELKVHDEDDMRAIGMGALLGVSAGSSEPARLIELTYTPEGVRGRVPTVCLVGKGLTFDAGGISIKPAGKMEDMKFDMCGGAAVLGAMKAIAARAPRVRVVGLVPASENLIDGSSYKPGDILRAMDGTTIEIRNTDAEGRLLLADALGYATRKLKPKPAAVIDLATLTGACVVALGDHHAALVSNDEKLAGRLLDASETSGDVLWRMPLVPGHKKQMASPYADISNLGSPGAGTLTAAAFLSHFAHKVPWAHLDIAGMAWTEKTAGVYSKGGTGFGVRVLSDLVAGWRA